MLNTNSNQTSSEAPNPEALDEFDRGLQFLSGLPTERAMKDLSKMKFVPDAVRKVVETMAISKMDLVRCFRLMHIREKCLRAEITADKAIEQWLKDNPNWDVELTLKDNADTQG